MVFDRWRRHVLLEACPVVRALATLLHKANNNNRFAITPFSNPLHASERTNCFYGIGDSPVNFCSRFRLDSESSFWAIARRRRSRSGVRRPSIWRGTVGSAKVD